MKHLLAFFARIGTLCLLLGAFAQNNAHAQFAKGADVSWISEMESSGYLWYNDNGTQQDLLQILKDHGMNTVRLRLWMNPSNGWSDWNDVIYKAQRARAMGFRILITIHYSDVWADPGTQTKPAVWNSLSFEQLMASLYDYTYNFMTALKAAGVTPEWVQVGNETNNGMLWGDGKASTNMSNYAWLINSGYNAIKAVSSSTKVIVHLANGYDNALFRWNIGGLISNGAQFDIVGMSLYVTPDNWQTYNSQCLANMKDMKNTYGKEVMIVEVGMRSDYPDACKSFIADIITKTRSASGLGVLYWEPQVYNGWAGYGLGAWQENGRPTVALDAFLEGSSTSTGITNGTYVITNRNSGKALDVNGCGTANGTNVQQWTNLGNTCQQWAVTKKSNGNYKIININSAKALDVVGCNTANFANVNQWTDLNNVCQEWYFTATDNGYYTITNSNSGKNLEVAYASTSNGANVGMYSSNGHYCQQWSFATAKNTQYNTTESTVTTYPNPVQEVLNFDGLTDNCSYALYTINGTAINNGTITDSKLNVQDLAPGMYIITLTVDGQARHAKFIKQ